MSLSAPRTINPATKIIEFNGEVGEFFYYDKENNEKVTLKMPLTFIVLDQLTCITGFNKTFKANLYSNEVRYLKDENLYVKSYKGGISITGKYNDVKDEIKADGGKYCKSVYAMLIMGDNFELVNFRFHGASFSGAGEGTKSGWFNFKGNIEQKSVLVREVEQGKNGSVTFVAPLFETGWFLAEKKAVFEKAIKMDLQLQEYLKGYFSKLVEQSTPESEITDPEPGNPVTDPAEFRGEDYGMIPRERTAPVSEDTPDDLPF